MVNRRYHLVAGVLLVLTVGGLRLTALARESFWYDEVVVARVARASLGEILSGKAGDLGNPPGFFALTHVWSFFVGDGEWSLRLLPAILGIAGVFVFWGFARRFTEGKATWVAVFFVGLHPLHVYLSQELRMYSLLFLLSVAIMWSAWHYSQTSSKYALAAYVIVSAAALYTHYYAGLLLCGVNLWFIGRKCPRQQKLLWVLAQLAVGIAFVPWLPRFLYQLTVRRSEVGTGRASRLHLLAFPLTILVGRTLVWKHAARILFGAVLALCVGLLGSSIYSRAKTRGVGGSFLLVCLAVPLVIAILMSFCADMDFFAARRGIVLLPAVAVLFAQGVSAMRQRCALLVCGVVFVLMGASIARYFTGANRDDWRSVAQCVRASIAPNDVLVFYPDIGETCFTYYGDPEDNLHKVRVLSVDQESMQLIGVSRGPSTSSHVSDLSNYVLQHQRVWAVLDADALAQEQCQGALDFLLLRSCMSRQWRFDRKLNVYLLEVARAKTPNCSQTDSAPNPVGNTIGINLYRKPPR